MPYADKQRELEHGRVYHRAWRKRNRKKYNASQLEWKKRHTEAARAIQRRSNDKAITTLSDAYIKRLLFGNRKRVALPDILIEAKRAQVALVRRKRRK